jgi:hypothetical protein
METNSINVTSVVLSIFALECCDIDVSLTPVLDDDP